MVYTASPRIPQEEPGLREEWSTSHAYRATVEIIALGGFYPFIIFIFILDKCMIKIFTTSKELDKYDT